MVDQYEMNRKVGEKNESAKSMRAPEKENQSGKGSEKGSFREETSGKQGQGQPQSPQQKPSDDRNRERDA